MKHILITRFDYPKDYKNLDKRIELFRELTVPSIQNQLCQDFIWAIKTKIPLSDLGLDCMNAVAVTDTKEAYALGDEDKIITTRLDNDDAVHTSYIANIQFYAEKVNPGAFIDFSGYCYDYSKGITYPSNKYTKMPSPFVSVLENRRIMRGIYMDQHTKLAQHGKVLKIDKRMYMQVIHDTNVSNKIVKVGEPLSKIQSKELWSLFGK